MTLNDALKNEFKNLIATAEYLKLMQDKEIDPKILIGAFEEMVTAKGQLNFDENDLHNPKAALVQYLRNSFIN